MSEEVTRDDERGTSRAGRAATMAFTQAHGRLPRVLLVEPEQALGEMLAGCFEDAGAHAVLVRSRATAGQFVSAMRFELALIASRVEDGSGVALAAELARIQPRIHLALVGDRHSVHTRFGGQDFLHAVLVKPIPRQRLLGLLEDALGVHTPSSSMPAMTRMPWMAEAEIPRQGDAETNRAVLARFAHL